MKILAGLTRLSNTSSTVILNTDTLVKCLNITCNTVSEKDYKMLVGKRSMMSGTLNEMNIEVSEKQITLWMEGALIQDVMPNLSADEREFLMTGITPSEWIEEIS
mgnify:CR=1 FL=1